MKRLQMIVENAIVCSLFCMETIEKYLEYFGYKNPKSVGEKEYFVETIGFLLPAVEIKENLKESK